MEWWVGWGKCGKVVEGGVGENGGRGDNEGGNRVVEDVVED